MTKILGLTTLLALCAGQVAAHSWINNPPQRFGDHLSTVAGVTDCLLNDDGTVFVDKNGHNLCGQDAQGIDDLVMRPNSFMDNPCYFGAGATFSDLPTGIVETDSNLCVQWAANSHNTDAGRNLDGGVRISLTTNLNKPSQADFDKMIVANNIPFENFAGTKVKVPAITPGEYLLQFYWSWPIVPTPAAGLPQRRLFISCSNLTVTAKGDPRIAAANSLVFPNLGLPKALGNTAPQGWFCNAADPIYGNASLPNGLGTTPGAPTAAPVTAASGVAPSAPSAPVTVVTVTNSNPATVAPTKPATVAPTIAPTVAPTVAASGAAPTVAGSVTITDLVDDIKLIIEPCTPTDDSTTINGAVYKEKCISVVNDVYSTLKYLTIRIRCSVEPIVRGLGGMTVESSSSRTYNVDLVGGVPRNTVLSKTSSFYYLQGTSSSVEFVAHSF